MSVCLCVSVCVCLCVVQAEGHGVKCSPLEIFKQSDKCDKIVVCFWGKDGQPVRLAGGFAKLADVAPHLRTCTSKSQGAL